MRRASCSSRATVAGTIEHAPRATGRSALTLSASASTIWSRTMSPPTTASPQDACTAGARAIVHVTASTVACLLGMSPRLVRHHAVTCEAGFAVVRPSAVIVAAKGPPEVRRTLSLARGGVQPSDRRHLYSWDPFHARSQMAMVAGRQETTCGSSC